MQDWQVKIQAHSPAWRGFLSLSLTISMDYLGQMFSDLVSETSLIVLKNLSTPLLQGIQFCTHLGGEGEVIAQVVNIVLQQEDQALVETVVLTLHVHVSAHTVVKLATLAPQSPSFQQHN
jgi:hypothetical protein